jgi:hypothetical protein
MFLRQAALRGEHANVTASIACFLREFILQHLLEARHILGVQRSVLRTEHECRRVVLQLDHQKFVDHKRTNLLLDNVRAIVAARGDGLQGIGRRVG